MRFATNATRVQHRDALRALIAEIFGAMPAAILLDRLALADLASARRNPVAGFLHHPQVVERDRWRTIGSPVGELRALLPPVQMDGVVPVMGAVPALGEHSEPILRELGFDEKTIEAWKKEQVI
jgi:formyl-CoA transferase